MPLARIGQTLLYFAHIPKTGGTSIEAYLREKGEVAMHHTRPGDWSACSPQHIHAAVHTTLFRPGFCDHAFAVLRDPLARLQSEYRYRAAQVKKRKGLDIQPFDDWITKTFRRYGKNPYVFDNHIRPQVEFLSEGMELFALEDGLDRVFDWIDHVTGDSRAVPRRWEKKLAPIPITMSEETRARIEEFYAADYTFLAGQGGRA
ncbi:sulfotransferase family 2 domain-containing protein [Marimonas lutisalis]|uniref:sulfotransferase family 2 domain-containing protein n=1 Tax=Marimonas lutisalis TaxID=2545756 RepID=UPI0010F7F212|nr:sulfotransferase family 2 domain-containing protein [Marimonas lutisalis]